MLGRLLATSRASFAPPLLFRGLAKQAGGKAGRGQKAQVSHGVAHVHTTYNNTIISVTTAEGDTVLWGSCGTVGFKGARRATYYAAQVAAEDVGRRARQDFGIKTLDINLKGLGQGRTACPKGLANVGLEITSIQDLTPKPHNGCRRRKPRRL